MLGLGRYLKKKIFLGCLYFISISAIIFMIYNLCVSDKSFLVKDSHPHESTSSNQQHYNQIRAHQSVLSGVSKDLDPYKISADKIDTICDDQFSMEKVDALYEIGKQKLVFNANIGFIDNVGKLLSLKDDVKIYLEEVMLFGNRINIDLVNKRIYSDERIDVSYKNSQIKADTLTSTSDILEFKGNVSTHINMLDF
ncbi:MAG: hypothetical protein EOP33_04315 [Rickettsiaceae bacterium]|nr:MAG: hypothetical protein EOP33_04315 [Rickettsiaceae bacterium]